MQKKQKVWYRGDSSLFNDFYFLTCIYASLVKIDDDKLQALLDEIQTMRKFQTWEQEGF